MIDLTVVIPTYNRRALLREAVASLRQQTYPADRFELLIISDGATDGTDDDYAAPLTGPDTRLVRQEKRGFGLARARNLGTKLARGRLVMFFDDDMTADPGLVAAHVGAHSAAHAALDEDTAVLGQVKLSPQVPATPFCRIILGEVCSRLDPASDRGHFVSFATALSWQTSFKREAQLRLNGYDETYHAYGWEDIEFSYRASLAGLRFWYEPSAVTFHNDQRQTLAAHGARLQSSSKLAPALFAQHPGLRAHISMYADKEPVAWGRDSGRLVAKKLARQLLTMPLIARGLEAVTPGVERIASPAVLRRWYYLLLGGYIQRGYWAGLARPTAQSA